MTVATRMVTDEVGTPVLRIGVITEPLGSHDTQALRFLILNLNVIQQGFEFELIKGLANDDLLMMLASTDILKRDDVRAKMIGFTERLKAHIEDKNLTFGRRQNVPMQPPPDKLVILTTARFDDNFIAARMPDVGPVCAIIALGNWERSMAPPTIVEFFLVLLLRQAVALVSPSLSGAAHLGTKGCLFDFTEELRDVRYKILNGFVCDYCTTALVRDGYPRLKQELAKVLARNWAGSSDEPDSVSSTTSKLGHDLFITKGLKPTSWEIVRSNLPLEVLKQILAVLATILGAALLFYLGFKLKP